MKNSKDKKNDKIKKNEYKNEKRRSILVYILLFIGLLLIYSRYIEPFNIYIKDYKIESKSIPKSYDGLKIVHFSDIHYGMTVDKKYLERIVDMINKQKPDLVLFTGDFIDKDTNLNDKEIKNINKILSGIESTLGNYAVSGNHDYKHISDFKKIFDGNFTILDNQERLIYYDNNTPISLVGFTDALEGDPDYKIFNNETDYFRIVMIHEPDEYDNIKKNNFNVMLSGHSHNGQIRVPLVGAIYTPVGSKTYYDKYYTFDNKELFISNGIGTSGVKFRLFNRPSINLYRLYSE